MFFLYWPIQSQIKLTGTKTSYYVWIIQQHFSVLAIVLICLLIHRIGNYCETLSIACSVTVGRPVADSGTTVANVFSHSARILSAILSELFAISRNWALP